jgi:hypothetical protein
VTTNYTNPTYQQREALATNQNFAQFVYIGLCNYAYLHYVEAASNPASQYNGYLSQALMNQSVIGSATEWDWRQSISRAIAFNQNTPVEWFSLTDDFSSVDADTLDALIDASWKPISGYTNYNT